MKIDLPKDFEQFSLGWLSHDALMKYRDAVENGVQAVSLRFNPAKCSGANYFVEPRYYKDTVKWCSAGIYLKERPIFAADPFFHSGLYYVQDASSMFPNLAFKMIDSVSGGLPLRQRRLKVLDLCASPGGKSTHLVSLIGRDSLLVSNETINGRTAALAENIARWGADNVVVTNNDASDFKRLKSFFDIILVDAPCSGEGMFRKSGAAVENWSRENVMLCAERQRRILNDIWDALAPGGFLIYSTCTYNEYENDGNLKFLTEKGGEPVEPAHEDLVFMEHAGIIPTALGGFQFIPGMTDGEGQYFAVVRKGDGEGKCGRNSKESGRTGRKGTDVRFGADFPGYDTVMCDTLLKVYRSSLHDDIAFVAKNLRTVSSGLLVAQIKGRDFIPHADFALSILMAGQLSSGCLAPYEKYFKSVEIERAAALHFLSREPLSLDDAPRGYLMLLYRGTALGFVKNLGNRVNNLHPIARRIRRTDLIADQDI